MFVLFKYTVQEGTIVGKGVEVAVGGTGVLVGVDVGPETGGAIWQVRLDGEQYPVQQRSLSVNKHA